MPNEATITISVSAPIYREKGVSILTTDAAASLIGQRSGLASSQRKALKKLLGEDSERVKAHLASLDLYGLFNEADQQSWDINHPIDIDRLTALRTLFLLPGELANAEDTSVQRRRDRDIFYMATSLWMVSREIGKSVPAAKTLKQLSLDRYEPYARVSDLRFDLIRRMCELEALPIQNPSAAWLIAEASTCLLREGGSASKVKVTSKREAYKRMQSGVDHFANPSCGINIKTVEDREIIKRFSEIVNATARKLAIEKTDSTFEKQYLKPYIAALRAWNSHYFKKLEPSKIERRRPGPRIGRAYEKS